MYTSLFKFLWLNKDLLTHHFTFPSASTESLAVRVPKLKHIILTNSEFIEVHWYFHGVSPTATLAHAQMPVTCRGNPVLPLQPCFWLILSIITFNDTSVAPENQFLIASFFFYLSKMPSCRRHNWRRGRVVYKSVY